MEGVALAMESGGKSRQLATSVSKYSNIRIFNIKIFNIRIFSVRIFNIRILKY